MVGTAITRPRGGQQADINRLVDPRLDDFFQLSHHPKTTGIGPVGARRQRGMLLHSVLAYAVEEEQLLGLAYGKVIVRSEAETSGGRKHNGGRRSLG